MLDCPDDDRLKKCIDYLTDNFLNEKILYLSYYWVTALVSLTKITIMLATFYYFFLILFFIIFSLLCTYNTLDR